MDSDLYDEFGNYIGPELESEDEDNEKQDLDVSSDEAEEEERVTYPFMYIFSDDILPLLILYPLEFVS